VIELFLQTGIRLSEAARLRVEDAVLPDAQQLPGIGSLSVWGRGRKQRTITLNSSACSAIAGYLATRSDADGLFRAYVREVYTATYDYLDTVSEEEFEKTVDAGFAPPMPARSFVANILAWHVATHQGEISALKGVQGLEGLVLTH
jgi:site-specific recombinase XerC